MPAVDMLIPVAIVLVAFAIWLFFWAVDSGQYDDLDGPAHSILFDDEDPMHVAGTSKNNQPQADAGNERKTDA